MNFATLKGLTIPEGVVTQITDDSGRVIWMLQNDKPVVLQVKKQTITTYAGETTYADESVILLDIYPKNANSKVNVTYGGVTKTLAFSGTNSKSVYFGTFNGVSDSVEVPASGTLTIEGGCSGFACGSYRNGSKTTNKGYCACITAITDWGSAATEIAPHAFDSNEEIALSELPDSIEVIGDGAFNMALNCVFTALPSNLKKIGDNALRDAAVMDTRKHKFTSLPNSLTYIGSYSCYFMDISISELPPDVTYIGEEAFRGASNMKQEVFTIPSGVSTIGNGAFSDENANPCSLFQKVIMLPTTPPAVTGLGKLPFGQVGSFSMQVPVGCGEAYKAAESWSAYADYITEVS